MQSADPPDRDILIKSVLTELKLETHQFPEILKPVNGLCEFGDLWHKTLDNHHRLDPYMTPFRSDPALYRMMSRGALQGCRRYFAGSMMDGMLCSLTKARLRSDFEVVAEFGCAQPWRHLAAVLVGACT